MLHESEARTHEPPSVVLDRTWRVSQVEPADLAGDAAGPALAARITRAASKQAYYTIRLLADPDRREAAYLAYAYFRWVDDRLDRPMSDRTERLEFLARQQEIVACAQRGQRTSGVTQEERLVEDLFRARPRPDGGLRSYVSHMLAVMDFDAARRGRLVTERELDRYSLDLSIAVTDALHSFIGHRHAPPESDARYMPAMAAHVTHMLRDTFEDVALGYYNVPREVLESYGIGPGDVWSAPYRAWVRHRVDAARAYFAQGTTYLDRVQSIRCRLAGYAYMSRFVGILDAIEREAYRLRPTYSEFARRGYALRMAGSVARNALLGGER